MPVSLMAQILEVASRASADFAGGRVVYQRGPQRRPFIATFGRDAEMAQDAVSGMSVVVEWSDRDFIFPAAELVFNGQICDPESGDRITVIDDDLTDGKVFQVLPIPGGKCFRTCDPQGFLIRVHTKRVE